MRDTAAADPLCGGLSPGLDQVRTLTPLRRAAIEGLLACVTADEHPSWPTVQKGFVRLLTRDVTRHIWVFK